MDLDRVINATPEDVTIIKAHAIQHLDRCVWQDDFIVMKYAASKLDYLKSMFSNYDLVLCPGDSPGKYIKACELTGILDDLNDVDVVSFPISGLRNTLSRWEEQLFVSYLSETLKLYNINDLDDKRVAMFDYVDSGSTYKVLKRSLETIYDTNVLLDTIQIPWVGTHVEHTLSQHVIQSVTNSIGNGPYDTLYDRGVFRRELRSLHHDAMVDGERTGRCMPSYKPSQLSSPPESIDTSACDTIASLVAFAYFHKL